MNSKRKKHRNTAEPCARLIANGLNNIFEARQGLRTVEEKVYVDREWHLRRWEIHTFWMVRQRQLNEPELMKLRPKHDALIERIRAHKDEVKALRRRKERTA